MQILRIAVWTCALSLLSPTAGLWGQSDAVPQDSLEDMRIKRTTRLAALIPGAGQITNRKYWKAPVVWGGMAWCISSIDFNLTQLDAARAHPIELKTIRPRISTHCNPLGEEAFTGETATSVGLPWSVSMP